MARIKIDVTAGILEVEGDEQFLRDIYEDFKQRVQVEPLSIGTLSEPPKAQLTDEAPTKKSKPVRSSRKESYKLLGDLDLSDKANTTSLKDFFAAKSPQNALMKTTVFVYYLQKIAKVETITPDHVYTCYKEVGQKVPTALRQNLLDTSHRKGTIDTSSMEAVTITTRGENVVEIDLPEKSPVNE